MCGPGILGKVQQAIQGKQLVRLYSPSFRIGDDVDIIGLQEIQCVAGKLVKNVGTAAGDMSGSTISDVVGSVCFSAGGALSLAGREETEHKDRSNCED